MTARRPGFTLIELLVVVGIIAILVSLLVPAGLSAREAARRTGCSNNLKQIALALHNYHGTHSAFPPGWVGAGAEGPDMAGSNAFAWGAMLLPELDQTPLWQTLDFELPASAIRNVKVRDQQLPSYVCPSDPSPESWTVNVNGLTLPRSNYVGSFGPVSLTELCYVDSQGGMLKPPPFQCDLPPASMGMFGHNSRRQLEDIEDGASNTLLVGEHRSDLQRTPVPWFSTWGAAFPEVPRTYARVVGVANHTPNDPAGQLEDFGSWHVDGALFALADGSVRYVSRNIDRPLYQALSTCAGGEMIEY